MEPADLAAEFDRRAEQYATIVDDLDGRDLSGFPHSRAFFEGKRDAYEDAAADLRDRLDGVND